MSREIPSPSELEIGELCFRTVRASLVEHGILSHVEWSSLTVNEQRAWAAGAVTVANHTIKMVGEVLDKMGVPMGVPKPLLDEARRRGKARS
jgi:hypothetical protein